MATPAATNGSQSPPDKGGAGGRAARELLIFGLAAGVGALLMPLLIWLVGNRILGPYTHGPDLRAGPLKLLGDFFVGLAHGSVIFWCVALGPYLIVVFVRMLYALIRPSPAASASRS